MPTFPVWQCAILIVMNILVIAYLVCVRPHRNETILVTTAIDEVVVMAVVVVFAVLYYKSNEYTDQKKRTIGIAIVVAIILSFSKNFVIIIYKGLRYLNKAYRRRVKRAQRRAKERIAIKLIPDLP